MDYCLRNVPDQLYGTATCGNGFTEEGEDCDCGLEQVCVKHHRSSQCKKIVPQSPLIIAKESLPSTDCYLLTSQT